MGKEEEITIRIKNPVREGTERMICKKCGHSMNNHGTTGNTKGVCLVPICNCGRSLI